MKNLISLIFLAGLLFAPVTEAKKQDSVVSTRALIQKIEKKQKAFRKKLSSVNLLKFVLAPQAPVQGDSIVAYVQNDSGYSDNEIVLEGYLDQSTSPLAFEKLASELWIFSLGTFQEISEHELRVKLYIQDQHEAQLIRDALAQLEVEIADLERRIAEETNEEIKNQLIAERDQKIAVKNDLIQALANLKSLVGEETLRFSVAAKESGTEFPRISGIDPNFGKASIGNVVNISGENFDPTASLEVRFGGITAQAASVVSSTLITATTPIFPSEGARDLELRFTKDGATKNAVLKNAYFATNRDVGMPNVRPVSRISPATLSIDLGQSASLDGSLSYDENFNDVLAHSWKFVSVPTGSSFPVGTVVSTAPFFSFQPDRVGFFVVEKVTRETNTQELLESFPSLAVVTVNEFVPPNNPPAPTAPGIAVSINGTKTSQVSPNDPDSPSHTYAITTTPTLGTATVSASGLVTYTAGATAGSDSLGVTVSDGSLSGSVTIPIDVVQNQAPVINDALFYTLRSQGVPYQVGLSTQVANTISDPEGQPLTLKWNFGDGTEEKTFDSSFAFLPHNYVTQGSFTAVLTATDPLGASASKSIIVNVVDTDIPTAKFTASPVSGAVPLTITFDASASGDADGITQYRWLWGDGSPEEVTTNPIISHTFQTAGNFSVRLRTRDQFRGQGESRVTVFPGGTNTGTASQAQFLVGPPREVLVGTPHSFDGSRSFNPNVGGTLQAYNWSWGDFISCPSNGCTGTGISTSYLYPTAGNYFPGLQVQSGAGSLSQRVFQEVFAVNAGHAARAILRASATSGVAPLTVSFDASESYDYAPGSISEFFWNFGDGQNASGVTAKHTFSTAGVYNVLLQIVDSDGNRTNVSQVISVTSAIEPTKKLDITQDPEREQEKQLLMNACTAGQGDACYYLGIMYEEEGDTFTKQKLWERACSLGYQEACILK